MRCCLGSVEAHRLRIENFSKPMIIQRNHVYQIFYDEQSLERLDPGFIPLDNRGSQKPDWYEMWPIREFLTREAVSLNPDHWYGFLSPKFGQKTGLTSENLHGFLNNLDPSIDALLVTTGWDQMAFFLNPFEQGEFWHPGLIDETTRFLEFASLPIKIEALIGTPRNAVFSNFIIAKPRFWQNWLSIMNQYVAFVDSVEKVAGLSMTDYGHHGHRAPMKAFIQERLTSLLLMSQNFNVVSLDNSLFADFMKPLFSESPETKTKLLALNTLKNEFKASKDPLYLEAFFKLRQSIPTTFKTCYELVSGRIQRLPP